MMTYQSHPYVVKRQQLSRAEYYAGAGEWTTDPDKAIRLAFPVAHHIQKMQDTMTAPVVIASPGGFVAHGVM